MVLYASMPDVSSINSIFLMRTIANLAVEAGVCCDIRLLILFMSSSHRIFLALMRAGLR